MGAAMRSLLRVLAAGTLVIGATGAAGAPVTVVMTGQITILSDASQLLIDGSVKVGTPYTLTMTYDDSVPDVQGSDPNLGEYNSPAGQSAYTISVGAYTFSSTSVLQIGIWDDDPAQYFGVPDALVWFVQGFTISGTLNPAVSLGSTRYSNPTLFDSSGLAHADDLLTSLAWTRGAYDPNSSAFNFSTSLIDPRTPTTRDFMEMFGTIDTITVLLPEPGTLVLLTAGLFPMLLRALR
jgi:hypothetical protein